MKKFKITMMVIAAILFSCVFMTGCIDGNEDEKEKSADKHPVLILQAYGNAGEGSPAGVSHSFVELYNPSDKAIDLSGISLYFANGKSGADVTEDEAWKSIDLTGKTIPAKGSFLVLGKEHEQVNNSTRYIIKDDDYGDINDNSLSLSRRSFKVAIIKSTETLTVQNPFTANNGKPISGYIDMVGAKNADTDNICGYEYAPARCSASVAVRRQDLIDTDKNSKDFIAARYGSTSGDDKTLTLEEFEVRKPRNSKAGEWDPVADPAEPPDTTGVDYTKLKLNEVSGVGNDTAKFYELKNIGNEDIPLSGCEIYYNANGATGGTLPTGEGELTWTGTASQVIEANKLLGLIGRNTAGSFTTGLTAGRILIITLKDPEGNVIDQCIRTSDTGDYAFTNKSFARIPDGTGDFYFAEPTPDATNGVSTEGLTKLPTDPPFITDFDRDIPSVTPTDTVTVSATVTPTTTSAISTVVIKWTLNGTAQSDINMPKASGNVYSAKIQAQPVNSVVAYKVFATNAIGETNSTSEQKYTVASADSVKLLILQAGASTNGAVSHNFVELYNAGDVDADLTGYSLQYANGGTPTDGAWSVINLSGTLPKHCSYLILGNARTGAASGSDTPKYGDITVSGDINESFTVSNNGFKVVLMNNTTPLTVQNPFDTDELGTKADGYIDMLGATNSTAVHGFETTVFSDLSKQKTARRKNIVDTDNNKNDFESIDYRTAGNVKEFQYPKTKTYGAWNPITGDKE
jgi:hypothetical protein